MFSEVVDNLLAGLTGAVGAFVANVGYGGQGDTDNGGEFRPGNVAAKTLDELAT